MEYDFDLGADYRLLVFLSARLCTVVVANVIDLSGAARAPRCVRYLSGRVQVSISIWCGCWLLAMMSMSSAGIRGVASACLIILVHGVIECAVRTMLRG